MRTLTTLLVALAASAAFASPRSEHKVYLETLTAHTFGTLSNLTIRERSFVSWSRGRWQAIEGSAELIAWFEQSETGDDVADRLRAALEPTRQLVPVDDSAELSGLEARVFQHALTKALDQESITFSSVFATRSVHTEPDETSPIRGLVGQGTFFTLLGRADGWAKICAWRDGHLIKGYLATDASAEFYAAPASPPAPLETLTPTRSRDLKAHYGSVLTLTLRTALSSLHHGERNFAHSVRAHWEPLETSPALLDFFARNDGEVSALLGMALQQARFLAPIPADELAALGEAEGAIMKQALDESATLLSIKYESPFEGEYLRESPSEDSLLRARLRPGLTLTLLDDSDPDYVRIRLFDRDHGVEGYLKRAPSMRLLAAPMPLDPAEAAAAEDASGFVNALLRKRR